MHSPSRRIVAREGVTQIVTEIFGQDLIWEVAVSKLLGCVISITLPVRIKDIADFSPLSVITDARLNT
jgi:hypothetical protein